MVSTEKYFDAIKDQTEAEIRWSLRNATNEVLVDIIISLLDLLKEYQVKCNDKCELNT